MNDYDYDCIVIGAGASGLVSASILGAAGRRVLVLEAAPRVGGCVQSWRPEAGFWLELGAHTAYNSYGPLLEALAARGRIGELLRRGKLGYRFLLADGTLQSPMKRLCFLEAAFHLPFGLGRPKAGRSVAEWFGRLLGRRNYRRLLAPAFAAVLSQPADSFPAEWLFRRKPRMQEAPRKFTFAGGLQGLLEAVAENAPFELRTGTPVRGIARDAAGFAVQAGDETLRCRQLVLATPVDAAAALLAGAYPEVARILQSFPMSSSEALGVVVPADACRVEPVAGLIGDDDDFWSVVTRDPVPHAAYRGFTFHFRPGRLDRAAKLARAAAVLGVPATAFAHVAEAINRLPAPGVEHPGRVAEVDAQLAREPLALVGNYLNGLSLGDCAERAAREAGRLLAL
ncbi:MAG: FAD-dependent oxidoreductase [Pseudomonadota bacterium]